MLSDVTLLVGEEKADIKAHKLILALSSPVFKSMFYSPLLESQDIVEIPDCRVDSFNTFIQVSQNVEPHLNVVIHPPAVVRPVQQSSHNLWRTGIRVNLHSLKSLLEISIQNFVNRLLLHVLTFFLLFCSVLYCVWLALLDC